MKDVNSKRSVSDVVNGQVKCESTHFDPLPQYFSEGVIHSEFH